MGKNSTDWVVRPHLESVGRVSPCRTPVVTNCYMYSAMRRYGKDPTQVRRSKTTFRDPLKLAARAHLYLLLE